MAHTTPLTVDRITGQIAPLGVITGFPSSYIRSAWPTPRGKPLTNHMIAKYEKQGKYVTNEVNHLKELKKQGPRAKQQRRGPLIEDFC